MLLFLVADKYSIYCLIGVLRLDIDVFLMIFDNVLSLVRNFQESVGLEVLHVWSV